MTGTELKAAFMSRKPVIWDSPQYGKIRYQRINAIKYTLNDSDEIIVSAELLDYNGGSITVVKASEVWIDEKAAAE